MTRRTSALIIVAATVVGCYATPPPQPESVVPRLIGLLQDPNPEVRQTAALSLGKIAPPEAASSLIRALRDANSLVRQYSAWGLGNLEENATAGAVPALFLLLGDPVSAVADSAAQAIGKIGAEPEATTELLAMLKDGPVQAKRTAVTVLGGLESPQSYPGLLNALQDDDARVRQGAIAALGELGDRRAVPAIEARLRDPDVGVRNEAAYRLGTLGDDRSLPALRITAGGDPNDSVRRWAQQAIEALAAPAEPESTT
jgi:HEAT repeat protein